MKTTVVYLIHFDEPYKHARHYIGSAVDLDARLEEHARGTGSRLMTVLMAAGIGWQLARTWDGGRQLERRLKTLGGAARLCPICSPDKRWGEFTNHIACKDSRSSVAFHRDPNSPTQGVTQCHK